MLNQTAMNSLVTQVFMAVNLKRAVLHSTKQLKLSHYTLCFSPQRYKRCPYFRAATKTNQINLQKLLPKKKKYARRHDATTNVV